MSLIRPDHQGAAREPLRFMVTGSEMSRTGTR